MKTGVIPTSSQNKQDLLMQHDNATPTPVQDSGQLYWGVLEGAIKGGEFRCDLALEIKRCLATILDYTQGRLKLDLVSRDPSGLEPIEVNHLNAMDLNALSPQWYVMPRRGPEAGLSFLTVEFDATALTAKVRTDDDQYFEVRSVGDLQGALSAWLRTQQMVNLIRKYLTPAEPPLTRLETEGPQGKSAATPSQVETPSADNWPIFRLVTKAFGGQTILNRTQWDEVVKQWKEKYTADIYQVRSPHDDTAGIPIFYSDRKQPGETLKAYFERYGLGSL
jgi:hypothetical protein